MNKFSRLICAAVLLAGGSPSLHAGAQTLTPRSNLTGGTLAAAALPAFPAPGQSQTHPGLHYAAYQEPEPAGDDGDGGGDGTYDVFYDRLADDGHWYYDDDYGYVFQPALAAGASDWRPYADGHWVWTDRGWCWVSNERFGWACYHYGRWVRIVGTGWVWIPGTVWAPAWVSWRQSDDYVGWAPLPPECEDSPTIQVATWCDRYYDIGPAAFCFVAFHDWGRPSYRHYLAPVQNNVTIINRTTNITNIVNNNRQVNNFGPQVQVVSQRLGQPIPEHHLNYITAPGRQGRFGTTAQGNQLQVVAPPTQLRRTASVQPAVQNRLGRAQVDRGWQNVNPAQAAQLRTQIAREAPAPASLPPKPVPPPQPQFVKAPSPGGKPGAAGATAVPANPVAETAKGKTAQKPVSTAGNAVPPALSGAAKTPEPQRQPHAGAHPNRAEPASPPHHAASGPSQNHPAEHRQGITHPSTHPVNQPHVAHPAHEPSHQAAAQHAPAPPAHVPGGSHPSHPASPPHKDEKKKHD
ncbi:MAG TPA: DUF6600 domain-containing protein [Chthoniobacterales bacterium]